MHTTNITTHMPIYKVCACVHDSDHMISACSPNSRPWYILFLVKHTQLVSITHSNLSHRKNTHNYTDTQVISITHRVDAKLRLLVCHQAYGPGWSNRILRRNCFCTVSWPSAWELSQFVLYCGKKSWYHVEENAFFKGYAKYCWINYSQSRPLQSHTITFGREVCCYCCLCCYYYYCYYC